MATSDIEDDSRIQRKWISCQCKQKMAADFLQGGNGEHASAGEY